MIANTASMEFVTTRTEPEALLLEGLGPRTLQALALADGLGRVGIDTRVQTAIAIPLPGGMGTHGAPRVADKNR